MCIPSKVKSSLFKYGHTTNLSSALIAASVVGPGIVWEPLGVLQVATVVVPACGVAPSPPSVIPPLASSVCVPVLVTERQAVVALASPVVLVVEPLVVVVEPLVLVVEPLVLVVETLVLVVEPLVLVVEAPLVVEPLVLKVAVESVVVVEWLAVVAAAATMLLLTTKEATKEPGSRLILARSLPPPPAISVAGAALACGQEKPLINLLTSS